MAQLKFQSPLHRGTSSDVRRLPRGAGNPEGFNPLFIGACLRTCGDCRGEPVTLKVSIPSSSGHVFGRGGG